MAIPVALLARQDEQIFKSDAELVVLHVNVFDKRSDAVQPPHAMPSYGKGQPAA